MLRLILLNILYSLSAVCSLAQTSPPVITGQWMNEDHNLEVEVYRVGTEYRARIIWFDDSDDPSSPMHSRQDLHNPDPAERSRRVCGLEVLEGLQYNAQDRQWEDGRIYDPSSGRTWDAKAWIGPRGRLMVRGYWHFSFLGRNLSFTRI